MTKGFIIRTFSRIPTLETERLILRKILPSDYKDMYEYSCDERVTKYLLWSPHPDMDHTYDYIESLQIAYKRGEFFDWALVVKDENKMIGTCGITSFDVLHKRAEIGYVISPAYWGKGFAHEAIEAVMEFIFYQLDMNRIEAHIIEGNERSINVAQSCGMRIEGALKEYMYIKGEYKNIVFCSIVKSDFKKRGLYRTIKQKSFIDKLGRAFGISFDE